MITIDTLRVDALGAYGSPLARTPNIDRLAREGTLFENAVSQAPATGPSTVSILTGLYPVEHGVVHSTKVLHPNQTTLAEMLQRHGYRTGAFIGSSILDKRYGMDQGFERFDDEVHRAYAPRFFERDAEQTTKRGMEWLAKVDGPFFLWLHYFDAHHPYLAHEQPAPPAQVASEQHLLMLQRERSPELLAESLPGIKALYAQEVTHVDRHVGLVLAALESRRDATPTLMVLSADHGEELFDHGFHYGHYEFLHQTVLHVPLVFTMLGGASSHVPAGLRIAAPVENVDIVPTVLSLLELPAPAGLRGVNLIPAMKGTRLPPRIVRSQREPYDNLPGGLAYAVRMGEWKLIYYAGKSNELYNMAKDPMERSNVIDAQPEIARALARQIAPIASSTVVSQADLNTADLELLRALGYVQ